MKMILAAAAAALLATPSVAAIYNFRLEGIVTEMTSPRDLSDEGLGYGWTPSEKDIRVGDKVTFSASVDSKAVVKWGDTGYSAAYLYGTAITFDLTAGGHSWHWAHDLFDGDPSYEDIVNDLFLAAPSVLFKDGKIAGVSGSLWPTGFFRPGNFTYNYTPGFAFGSSTPRGVKDFTYDPGTSEFGLPYNYTWEELGPRHMNSAFYIHRTFAYGNGYAGPEFKGIWNFAESYGAVPEPGTWSLLIAGFGIVGWAARRQRGDGRKATPARAKS